MTSYLKKEKNIFCSTFFRTHFAKSQVSAFTKSNKEGKDQESIHNQEPHLLYLLYLLATP